MNNTNLATINQEKKNISVFSDYTNEELALIKGQVAKNATDLELTWFLKFCQSYNLDPIKKQVWFWKGGKAGFTIMIARDGYLAHAQRSPEYEGLQSSTIYEEDEFEPDFMNGTVKHIPKFKSKNIIGAWAICYRKNRRPQLTICRWEDFVKDGSDSWRNNRADMIEKCAHTRSLSKQFPIEGGTPGEEFELDRIKNVTPEGISEDGEILDSPTPPKKEKSDPLNDIVDNAQKQEPQPEETQTPDEYFLDLLDRNFDLLREECSDFSFGIAGYENPNDLIKPLMKFLNGNLSKTAMNKAQKDEQKFLSVFSEFLVKENS